MSYGEIRRINLLSGPGTGKSTAAAYLFYRLKELGKRVEYIQEYVKEWAYEGRKITSFDQLYIFAKQLRREDLVLGKGVDIVVTDSPLYLALSYMIKYGFPCPESLESVVRIFDEKYPPLNILLVRSDGSYEQEGRYETPEEAVVMDEMIRAHLVSRGLEFHEIAHHDLKGLYAVVTSLIPMPVEED